MLDELQRICRVRGASLSVTLWPWELTASEWLGPRLVGRELERMPVTRPKRAPVAPNLPRYPFEDVWWSDIGQGLLLYDAEHAGRLVGSLCWFETFRLDERYRGRGLAARLLGRYYYDHGRSELEYLRTQVQITVNFRGAVLTLVSHREGVKLALEHGREVSERVRASTTTEAHDEILRLRRPRRR